MILIYGILLGEAPCSESGIHIVILGESIHIVELGTERHRLVVLAAADVLAG